MDCPKCQVVLNRVKASRHPAFCCPECSGHVCEQRGITTLPFADLSAPGAEAVVAAMEKVLPCPKASEHQLVPRVVAIQGGETVLAVQHCEQCHVVWYDAEELRRVELGFDAALRAVNTAIFQHRVEEREAEEERLFEEHLKEPSPGYESVFSGFGLWLLIGGLAAASLLVFLIWFYSSTDDFKHPSTRPADSNPRPEGSSE